MLRKIGVAIAYFIAGIYILSILLPSMYCLQHGCRGPGEADAFMPAFAFTPFGAIATAFALHEAVINIRKKRLPWIFWPLAIVFAIVLAAVIALIAIIVYYTAFPR